MIPWVEPKLWGNERSYLIDAFDSTWFSSGEYVKKLEEKFAQIHDVKHAITTCNGTASIYLILDALNIGHGDKVVVPAFGFGAAANIVSAIGAEVIFCDIDPETFLMCPRDFERIVNQIKDIKAVIPIHSYGSVCEMNDIVRICKEKSIVVIEDVAEAMFSKYDGQYAGTIGDINSFSFQTTKTISTGEGGCILTSNTELYKKMSLIRNHGMAEKKYWHLERGNNFRLSNLLASIGYAQLEHWEENIRLRKNIFKKYTDMFSTIDGIKLQKIESNVDPVMWAFAVYLEDEFSSLSRDDIMNKMMKSGIETRPGFYTFNQMGMHNAPLLKNADDVAQRLICLPFYPSLTEELISRIYEEFVLLKR